MADKLQNTSNIDIIASSKPALVTDLNSSYTSKEQYSHARNAVRNSKDGDLGTIGNEPSNILSFSAPYDICGAITLPDDTIMIFSGDGKNSEIGIGNPKDNSYKKIKNLSCLNFTTAHPIIGVAKKDFNKGVVVTFTDKNNPVRRVELNTLSSITSCDEILLFKKIDIPCLSVKKGQVGNMPNGTYSIAIAYSVDDNVFTDWYSISNRIALYSETQNNSLEVNISNLDSEFEEFSVAVVGNYIDPVTKGATKVVKIIGTYSTKVKSFSISDFINSQYEEIKVSQLVINKKTWQKAGIISSNANYLVLGDLVSREEENYQLKALDIEAEYVVEQVEADYYSNDGIDVGYYRDENYDFYIQGVYNTGEFTDRYHIPGRTSTAFDRASISSSDVYEYDKQFQDCEDPGKVQRWQVENTAGKMIKYQNEFSCGRRTLGRGEMGYFQSSELYPDNPAMYGDLANTNILFHKMPDECKVPRYSKIDGKYYVNILGVRFKNIPSFTNPDIVGYRILRSDRKGGNGTVIARGLLSNVRWYEDEQMKQTIMYTNYTVNDLSPDVYLSATQTAYKNKKETRYTPLTNYYKDKFNFFSPHTNFEPRYSLGTELKLESEEVATIKGRFEKVYNHPRQKLMNQFSFWLSSAVGFIEAALTIAGHKNFTSEKEFQVKTTTIDGGIIKISRAGEEQKIESVKDLVGIDIIKLIQTKIAAADLSAITIITNVLALLGALAIKIPYSLFAGIKIADETLETIRNFTGYTDYVYQYNAHALFENSICVENGNKRRRLTKAAKYIPSDVVSIDDKIYNNYFREKTVLMEVNKEFTVPKTKDTSRNTISGFKACDNPEDVITSTGSAYYATSKIPNPNQYGRVGSSSIVSMHSCVLSGETSPILYGGDCIISRFQMMKKMQFFNQNLANTNYPDGVEYDYRLYRNIAYPRYWMDSTKYDFSELLSGNTVNFTKFSRTTAGKYNLDCKKSNDGKNIARIDDAYMYLSNNCVIDFFVECDYIIDFREKSQVQHYSKDNTNLSFLFRSDNLEKQEEFNISRVYSDIYTTELVSLQQREDFSETNRISTNQENSVIYSLPAFNLQKADNWQYFLPANYFAFRESDFGTLTSVHKLDQDRMIFLFSKSSPFVSVGRDFLQLEQSGRKIEIGDGGLFAQDPRELLPTDNNYSSSTSRYAFSNTHLGRFYPSERQGRIISYTESLNDVSRQGMSYWCKNYMPIFLYKYFPTYNEQENPISRVGYLSSFDSVNETYYLSKRDFSPKIAGIVYKNGKFTYNNIEISLRDEKYFNDISWTLSYSPTEEAFISYHDWHPDWIIQTENHFLSVKGKGVWKHNESYESFCNFFGKDFPFELEVTSNSGQQIETVRNIEYILEVYKYKNSGRDRFHVLNENFDRLIVHNTEQISPLLNLVKGNPNPEENLKYPKKASNISYDVTFFKEENKYRVNQFWDSVKDRGEFTNSEVHLFPTDESGYKQIINPAALDINKLEEQRKKFRHYFNKFRLIKTISGDKKFLSKILNIKKLLSSR